MDLLEAPPLPFHFTPEHEQFRASLRDFIAREVTPHVHEWDEAETFPRALYARMAELGVQGLGYPEAYGGTPADLFYQLIVAEEFARCGGGGVQASLNSHSIALPPVLKAGSEALRQRVIPPVLAGQKIAALAITEPSGGSDVASLRTTAVRDGDHYIVNGEKTFITSGVRADFITTAVRTDPTAKGAGGISLLVIDGDTPGLTRTPLKKMGWWSSDTAHLRFDQCRVPVAHRVGEENQGFKLVMNNFNSERLFMAVLACGYAEVCMQEALDWTRQRSVGGSVLSQRQVVRHKLMDMAMRIDATRALLYDLTYRIEHQLAQPAQLVARVCLAKVQATQTMQFCADQAVQLLGGMGFMRGTKSERIYREVKVMMIGGGAEEVMKDLAARQLGI
ncbi:MAG: acyl-CoA dehydrogenase family protein [Gammaproteobacteria bacterium]|uniref:acyl-CoA dehydrogenase family protein n=1 Tax=unclassified Pseudacidovorax TaxID=2620592 RepID=UPI001B5C201B|nr:acyl-CoA dehydrogenase family protein [Pseudacidovorax sp.]MBP6896250.1 acyl-CoA dehydrogenase family protein [Pseudacidovorax sp.]